MLNDHPGSFLTSPTAPRSHTQVSTWIENSNSVSDHCVTFINLDCSPARPILTN